MKIGLFSKKFKYIDYYTLEQTYTHRHARYDQNIAEYAIYVSITIFTTVEDASQVTSSVTITTLKNGTKYAKMDFLVKV